MSLYKRTTAGIAWNLIQKFGQRGINGIVTLVLAWFLSPKDFGLIAMITVFIQLANSLMMSGFSEALIQKKDADQADFCTAFYSNIALGIVSYLVLFVSAPFIAEFYGEPRLVLLLRVVGINIIINSFQIIQQAGLAKELKFKALAKSSIPGAIISGVIAIGVARQGYGVWALVAQMLLATFFTTLFLWSIYGWRPKLLFSMASLSKLYGFGSKLFLANILNIIFQNIFVVVIAKYFSAQEAGYYFFAHKIRQLIIFEVVATIKNVSFPALTSIQDKTEKLKTGFRQLLQVLSFIMFPVVIFTAALADPLFKILFPDTWLPTVPFLQLLFIAGFFLPLHTVNLNILKVKGRSDLFLFLEIVKKGLVILVLMVSFQFGIYGILLGQVLNSIIGYFPNSFFSKKLIGYSVREQLMDVAFSFILAVLLGATISLLVLQSNLPEVFKVIVFGIGAIFFYFFFSLVVSCQAISTIKVILSKQRNST